MPTKDEVEKQIRFHEGQSEWTWWSNRVTKLEEDVETFAFWAESEDITAVCDGMPAVHKVLSAELKKARAKLESLAEFAPKKGRKAR
jgi:hypothetical protein